MIKPYLHRLRLRRKTSAWASGGTAGGRQNQGGKTTQSSFFSEKLHLISPTHKRTEGRAPVWSSKFTKKVALKGEFYSFFSYCSFLQIKKTRVFVPF